MCKTLQSRMYYGTFSALYSIITRLDGYQRGVRNFVQSQSFIQNSSKILDAGCGNGLVTFSLADVLPSTTIVGFDLSRNMIKQAVKRKNQKGYTLAEFYMGDLEESDKIYTLEGMPRVVEKNEFDHIFAAGSLEYVDAAAGICGLARHLKSGGYFVDIAVRDNNFGKLVGAMTGFHPHSLQTLKQSFEHAHLTELEIKKIRYFDEWSAHFMYAIIGKKK